MGGACEDNNPAASPLRLARGEALLVQGDPSSPLRSPQGDMEGYSAKVSSLEDAIALPDSHCTGEGSV